MDGGWRGIDGDLTGTRAVPRGPFWMPKPKPWTSIKTSIPCARTADPALLTGHDRATSLGNCGGPSWGAGVGGLSNMRRSRLAGRYFRREAIGCDSWTRASGCRRESVCARARVCVPPARSLRPRCSPLPPGLSPMLLEFQMAQYKNVLTERMQLKYSLDSLLFNPPLVRSVFRFLNYASLWLLRVAFGSLDDDFPGTLPSEPPEDFAALPEFMVDSLADILLLYLRHGPRFQCISHDLDVKNLITMLVHFMPRCCAWGVCVGGGGGAGMHKKGRDLRGSPRGGQMSGWRRLPKRLGATVDYKCC